MPVLEGSGKFCNVYISRKLDNACNGERVLESCKPGPVSLSMKTLKRYLGGRSRAYACRPILAGSGT